MITNAPTVPPTVAPTTAREEEDSSLLMLVAIGVGAMLCVVIAVSCAVYCCCLRTPTADSLAPTKLHDARPHAPGVTHIPMTLTSGCMAVPPPAFPAQSGAGLSPRSKSGNVGRACPACTFINEPTVAICSVCGMQLQQPVIASMGRTTSDIGRQIKPLEQM